MDVGQLAVHVVEQSVELRVHGWPVGLVVDAVQHRLDRGHIAFGVTDMRLAA